MSGEGARRVQSATPDAVDEYVRCYSMPGGIRAMLSIYRAMLVDAEQNRQAAQKKLDIPVLAAETSDGCHWNAATWIQHRALDMMRTSAHYKGGITGAIKVAHLAESFGMRAQVHGGGGVPHAYV